eukprot:GGOE01037269.1.p1 GENE.GGOE01037269.1~~GGOE01037269.1.p1  ORF type:complete len:520 (+),score=118.69 GGOE01037269.1:95-1654(+)
MMDAAIERRTQLNQRLRELEDAIAERGRRLNAIRQAADVSNESDSVPLAPFQRHSKEAAPRGPTPIATNLLQQSLLLEGDDETIGRPSSPPAKRCKGDPDPCGERNPGGNGLGDIAYFILRLVPRGTSCTAITVGMHKGLVSCPAPCRAALAATQKEGRRLLLFATIVGTQHFQGLLSVTADVASCSPVAELPVLWLVVASIPNALVCQQLPAMTEVLQQQGLLLALPSAVGAPLCDLLRQHGAPPLPAISLPLTAGERDLLARHAALSAEGNASPQASASQPPPASVGDGRPTESSIAMAPGLPSGFLPAMGATAGMGGVNLNSFVNPGLLPVPTLINLPMGGPIMPFPMCMVSLPPGLAMATMASPVPQLYSGTTAPLTTVPNSSPYNGILGVPPPKPMASQIKATPAEPAAAPKTEPAQQVWVKGLQPGCGSIPLGVFFGSYGNVVDCDVIHDPASGQGNGWGYVAFDSPEAAQMVLKRTHTFRGVRLQLFSGTEVESDPQFLASIHRPPQPPASH